LGTKPPVGFHEVGLGRQVALHAQLVIGEERRGVEGVGLALFDGEAVLGDHPLVIGGEAVVPDQERQVLQLFPAVGDAGMGEDDLRVLLEDRGDVDDRDLLGRGVERLQQVAAHVELDAVGQQERAVVDLRAAGDDRHVEAAFRVGAIRDGLVEAAMFGLGQPVGAEGDLIRSCAAGASGERGGQARRKDVRSMGGFSPKVVVMPPTLGTRARTARAG
jgi:hypothetical protein